MTLASLLYEAGASPAYVMGQMGHASSAFALEVCSRMTSRDRDTGARLDALVRGADRAPLIGHRWAPTTSAACRVLSVLNR